MPTPTVYPGSRSFFGIGKETTAGTPVAPIRFVPWKKMDPADAPKILVDDGMRGSMGADYGATLGTTEASLDAEGPVFADSLGDLLLNIMGDYTVSGAGPYIHTFALGNSAATSQPPTHTVVDYTGMTPTVGARAYPSVCLSELTFTGNSEALFTHSAKASCWQSAAAASAPTNAPTADLVVPSWRSVVSIGGVTALNVAEWEVSIKRALAPKWTGNGSQNPYIIGRTDLSVEGKLTVVADGEGPLNALLANTQQALVFTVDNGLLTTSQRTVTLTMTKVYYKSAKPKRDTLIGYDIEFEALFNATDAGASGSLAPIKVTVKNGITTY